MIFRKLRARKFLIKLAKIFLVTKTTPLIFVRIVSSVRSYVVAKRTKMKFTRVIPELWLTLILAMYTT